MPFPIGTVSAGTLRTEDLLNAFADELEHRLPDAPCAANNEPYVKLIWDAREAAERDDCDNDDLDIVVELEGALNEVCPPYIYFGTLEGDGSDFGFWPDIESLQEDMRSGEIDPALEVDINDHGNVTVYVTRGTEREELWACI